MDFFLPYNLRFLFEEIKDSIHLDFFYIKIIFLLENFYKMVYPKYPLEQEKNYFLDK